MEIRGYLLFSCCSKGESITKVHITQHVLSRKLFRMEDETGARLFRMATRKIVLINEGDASGQFAAITVIARCIGTEDGKLKIALLHIV